MTVFVYVNTSRQVGDLDHVKVFATQTPPKHGSRKTIPKGSPLNMRFWSDRIGLTIETALAPARQGRQPWRFSSGRRKPEATDSRRATSFQFPYRRNRRSRGESTKGFR